MTAYNAETRPDHIHTLGLLKQSGYRIRSIKEEIRENLRLKIASGDTVFQGIYGYEDSVIPQVERALLSQHNILLLGLRGQAKTRLARMIPSLLDAWIPVVSGSAIQDDPFMPISRYAKDLIAKHGDDTPITWMASADRYVEKLATPDVSVADLIGDSDPILAANLKLPYSDERVMHFGLIPRAHRCIFVLNELPDLQPRIQVALFNILQEGDIQIRGFRLRMALDIQFIFTANPEDYTHRGSIVTPLKDRIESQILTHYPERIEDSKKITLQEAQPAEAQLSQLDCPEILHTLLEQLAIEARRSEYVDQKSGVSARMTISAYENLLSTAERRMLRNQESNTTVRISDLWGAIPGLTGKMELVYEGEQEGSMMVAEHLISKALRALFISYFPDPNKSQKKKNIEPSPYTEIVDWFTQGNRLETELEMSDAQYQARLHTVPGLSALVQKSIPGIRAEALPVWMEFLLHGLSEYSLLRRDKLKNGGLSFTDILNHMFSDMEDEDAS